MDNKELNQLITEHLAGIKSESGDKVYEVCKKILGCPRMITCLDINDINTTVHNCDATEAVAIDCLGKEVSDKVEGALRQMASKSGFIPQNLLVFIEQHNGYSIVMSDMVSFQDALKAMPAEINVVWGVGNNPSGEGQVGLYFLMGYKKIEGVSQNESGND